MRLNTLEKLYNCLKDESPEIKVDAEIARESGETDQEDAGDFCKTGIIVNYSLVAGILR